MAQRYNLVLFLAAAALRAETLPVITAVDHQPLAANATRVVDALALLGEPFSEAEASELRRGPSVERIQQLLDARALAYVEINPESRVHVIEGPAAPELVEQGWRVFLIKVANQAGITPVLLVDSPNAGTVPTMPEGFGPRRFLDLSMYTKPPMKERLSGLAVEYRVLQIYSRDPGKREAKLFFNVGQGSQDLGFRSEVDILFTTRPASKVTLHILDAGGQPTTAAFLIRDRLERVYPATSKRVAPDFFFQKQIYRADGESVPLPEGDYSIECTRGPEYRKQARSVHIGREPSTLTFQLERWIDPSKLGWYSGDHHIHAAGCAHYEKPTEGVYPQDMMRHILGEDLKVGAVLTWGPGWYFQKTFFEGRDNSLSTAANKMHYDVEVSGFPSSHTGHLVLLGLEQQDYPGAKRIEEWPSWGVPILRWARKQGAVVGYAHSGWGLALKNEKLPSDEIPPFDGIGANEFIVSVTEGLPDFISSVDTPYAWELNIWYHTLNAGFRTRISGETDFPCIYDARVGLGRSYVRQARALDYEDWVRGLRDGRNYVSDGGSHLIDFRVGDAVMGEATSELKLDAPAKLAITAQVAAMLPETPDASIQSKRYDDKPYWSIERARIGATREVPVELIVNGQPVARQQIVADGKLRPIRFDYAVDSSSWVALRVLPSSHTNPVFVLVGGKPIRVRSSIDWCMRAVDQCASQKLPRIRLEERGEAQRAYDKAREIYRSRLN